MILRDVPSDLKAEALMNYLPRQGRIVSLCGSHKRNAYEDFSSITQDENNLLHLEIKRNGLYDILPEGLFHPIDRFENIGANEYKERFKEEVEQQQIEESNARGFFATIDAALIELSAIVSRHKDYYSDNSIVSRIICDRLPDSYRENRFVTRTLSYIPHCHILRGNKSLLSLMLRKVLYDEDVTLLGEVITTSVIDEQPAYCTVIDAPESDCMYLGNEFEEDVTGYAVKYWKETECNEHFPEFINEISVYESFLNEYFIGVESRLRFVIYTDTSLVRFDDLFYNYLDHNTNL